jgi:hypothetical protein
MHEIGMIGPIHPLYIEREFLPLFSCVSQRLRETVIRDVPSQKTGRKGQVYALFPVDLRVGSTRIERQAQLAVFVSPEGTDHAPDTKGTGGVGTAGAPHDRPQDIVENTDLFHGSPRFKNQMYTGTSMIYYAFPDKK